MLHEFFVRLNHQPQAMQTQTIKENNQNLKPYHTKLIVMCRVTAVILHAEPLKTSSTGKNTD